MKKLFLLLGLIFFLSVTLFFLSKTHTSKNISPTPSIPSTITLTPSTVSRGNGGCKIGGCSGQICSDRGDIITTCEYGEEYSCYHSAICERQKDGKCGWTETEELKTCLQKVENNSVKAPVAQ